MANMNYVVYFPAAMQQKESITTLTYENHQITAGGYAQENLDGRTTRSSPGCEGTYFVAELKVWGHMESYGLSPGEIWYGHMVKKL